VPGAVGSLRSSGSTPRRRGPGGLGVTFLVLNSGGGASPGAFVTATVLNSGGGGSPGAFVTATVLNSGGGVSPAVTPSA
jgi:hypothetical protein